MQLFCAIILLLPARQVSFNSTYTAQDLYSEYEAEMTEFLNGLVIND
jgi:hypothetical protein